MSDQLSESLASELDGVAQDMGKWKIGRFGNVECMRWFFGNR